MHGANDWLGGGVIPTQVTPGVSLMLVSGLFKFTKRRSFCCWCREKARNPFGGVQEFMDRLGAWLWKGEFCLVGTPGTGLVGQSRPRAQEGPG